MWLAWMPLYLPIVIALILTGLSLWLDKILAQKFAEKKEKQD